MKSPTFIMHFRLQQRTITPVMDNMITQWMLMPNDYVAFMTASSRFGNTKTIDVYLCIEDDRLVSNYDKKLEILIIDLRVNPATIIVDKWIPFNTIHIEGVVYGTFICMT